MRRYLQYFWGNEFYKAGVFLTVSGQFNNFLNYYFNIMTAKAIGPAGFGEINAVMSYIGIISLPVSIISTILIQKISSAGKDQIAVMYSLEHYYWKKLTNWWFLIIPIIILTPFLPKITNLTPVATYFMFPFIILSIISSFYSAAYQGLKLFFLLSVIPIAAMLVKLAGPWLVLHGVDGLGTILLFIFLSSLITYGLMKYYLPKKQTAADNITKQFDQRLLHIIRRPHFVITTFSLLGIVMFGNADIIFVKKYFSAVDAGIYSSWSIFAKIVLYLIGPVSQLALVYFSQGTEIDRQNKMMQISLVLLGFIGFGIYICYHYFGSFLIPFFFTKKFNNVIPFLGSAAVFGTFYTFIIYLNNYFLAKKSYFALILPAGIPFYVILFFIFGHTLGAVMNINIFFSAVVGLLYLGSYFYRWTSNRVL